MCALKMFHVYENFTYGNLGDLKLKHDFLSPLLVNEEGHSFCVWWLVLTLWKGTSQRFVQVLKLNYLLLLLYTKLQN